MGALATPMPGRALEYTISDGAEGVKQTLYLMRDIVRRFRSDAFLMTQARLALAGVPSRSWAEEARALCRFVQRSVRYTLDPRDVEGIIEPDRLLREVKAGDCDDMALLLATLLESVGHPARFVACGFEHEPYGTLSHVFVQTRVGNRWLSLDPSEPYEPGWEPPNVKTCYVVNV